MTESYVSPGSPNSATSGLLALTLDPDDTFWTAAEAPLPVEVADFELVLPEPGFVITGRRATGQVLLLNSRAGHVSDVARHDYTPKYGKLVYSTHHPFNVVPVAGSYAPDAMLALTPDGRSFGHRVLTRQSGAAPGFIWCQFDQDIDDTPQAMWAAVALWEDVQVVLAVLRPTRPVRAFHAPGALGCDRPSDIRRRSDRSRGWEYAEAEARAVGVCRLIGYDDQRPSAPFQGDSTLNLAYAYAEQPVVCEREASARARCLASLALVRPAPFEPEVVFDGFRVTVEAGDRFHVAGPDGAQAMVCLAPRVLRQATLGGVLFDGPDLRYARLAPGNNGCAGLGVSRAGGMVSFEGPAIFRLGREGHGLIHLLTNAGAALDRDWLGGRPRRAEVRALDGEWVHLDEPSDERLPAAVVRAWQKHNERQMVEFRFWL
jgi:hypothetical protein